VKREDVLQQTILPESGRPAIEETVEKRRHARIAVSVSAEIVEPKTHARVTGRATDLGVGGCYIDTLSTFSEGTEVEVLLHAEGRTLHCRALVTYVASGAGLGMGLAFTEAVTGQQATLLDWMSGLGGLAPVELPEKAAPECTPDGESEPNKPPDDLKEVVLALVELLLHKELLTESEADQLRTRPSD
jgi:hypothetical protein